MWFDCGFRTDVLSTSPWNSATHWRQMLFPFDDGIVLHEGDHCEGSLRMKADNNFSYSVSVEVGFLCGCVILIFEVMPTIFNSFCHFGG